MNLTDGKTFPTALIKFAKTIFNQKIEFPRDTKRRIKKITINTGCNTHIFRYCVRNVMKVLKKDIFSVDYQNLFYYHTSGPRQNVCIRSQIFTLYFLMSHKTHPLKYLLYIQIHTIKNMYLMLLSRIFYKKIKVPMGSVHCLF